MPAAPLSSDAIVVEVLGSTTTLYRICHLEGEAPAEDTFRSAYAQGRPPRRDAERATVLHMALSMYDSLDGARGLARRFRTLGDHIAVVELQPDHGVCIADTLGPGHWSIWARVDALTPMVADVVGVDR